jgi:drug/metabolite transporter (DMT)-like permease
MMLGTVMIWGLNFTAVKLALRDFSPLAFNGLRFTVATLVMLGFLWQRTRTPGSGQSMAPSRRDWPAIIGLGLLGHALYQILFIGGMVLTTPANSSLLLATAPIWVAVLGYLLHIERISRVTWAGILLSFCGILVLILGGGGHVDLGGATTRGDLLLLGCAIVWAVYTTASKPLLTRYSPLKLTALSMLAGTIPLVIICFPSMIQQNWAAVTPVGWISFLFSTLLSVVVGYLVWYTSVQRVGNARTAVYSNLTPVFAIIFAWIILDSTLVPLQLLGGVVVLAGLILTRRGRGRQRAA